MPGIGGGGGGPEFGMGGGGGALELGMGGGGGGAAPLLGIGGGGGGDEGPPAGAGEVGVEPAPAETSRGGPMVPKRIDAS